MWQTEQKTGEFSEMDTASPDLMSYLRFHNNKLCQYSTKDEKTVYNCSVPIKKKLN